MYLAAKEVGHDCWRDDFFSSVDFSPYELDMAVVDRSEVTGNFAKRVRLEIGFIASLVMEFAYSQMHDPAGHSGYCLDSQFNEHSSAFEGVRS
jgi:hypothetical protein